VYWQFASLHAMHQYAAKHKLSQAMSDEQLADLFHILRITIYSPELQAVFKPKVRSHLVYFMKTTMGMDMIKLGPRHYKCSWPEYTKTWLSKTWDGDWTEPAHKKANPTGKTVKLTVAKEKPLASEVDSGSEEESGADDVEEITVHLLSLLPSQRT